MKYGSTSGLAAAFLLVFGVCLLDVHAASLIILRNHQSVWARDIHLEDDVYHYVNERTGEARQLPVAKVDMVVESVVRGRTYTANEIEAGLAEVRRAIQRHGRLMKQLKQLENEWELAGTLAGDTPDEIASIVAHYKRSPGSAAYRDAMMKLQMIAYKDIQERYKVPLDQALDEIKATYYGVDLRELERQAVSTDLTVEVLNQMRRDGMKVLRKGGNNEEDKDRVRTIISQARDTLIARTLQEADEVLGEGRDVLVSFRAFERLLSDAEQAVAKTDAQKRRLADHRDAAAQAAISEFSGLAGKMAAAVSPRSLNPYLRSRMVAQLLLDNVARSADEKQAVDAVIASAVDKAAAALPKFDFSMQGFPLTKGEFARFDTLGNFASTQPIPGRGQVVQRGLILPLKPPEAGRMAAPMVLPCVIVFNEAIGRDFDYGLVLQGKKATHLTPLSRLAPRMGRISMPRLRLDLPALAQKTTPISAGDDQYVLLYLARKAKAMGKWTPASLACRIPVATATP